MSDLVRIGILKLGCIGAAPLLDLILDERAERKDIDVRVVTTGASMNPEMCAEATNNLIAMEPELVLIVSPNAAVKGPTKAREILLEKKIPIVTISDGPSKKAFQQKNDAGKKVMVVPDGSGYIILPMDPMIGARKEFLDPTEMAIFNAELIKVLSCTGVMRLLQSEIDKLTDALKAKKALKLPTIQVKVEKALEQADFKNPYAYAKAYAALKMSESVAEITTTACFKEQDPAVYVPAAAAAHELLRAAAKLADEAREIEKMHDTVLRTPHGSSGKVQKKTKLSEKPA